MIDTDTLVYLGSPVKALGDGRVGGHLVLFSTAADPDLTGDYFTAQTHFRLKGAPLLLYEHGFDARIGDREIGDAEVKIDDVGVWVEAQLALRDEYERAIYAMAERGKLGWSSGSAGHLVRRRPVGKAHEVLSWPIVEASLTTHPAEPRTLAVPLKSLYPSADGLPASPYADQLDAALAALVECTGRGRSIHDLRVKVGRTLSSASRGRLQTLRDRVTAALEDLDALLAETEVPASDTLPTIDVTQKAAALRAALLHRKHFTRTQSHIWTD